MKNESWIGPAKVGLAVVWLVSLGCVLSPGSFPAGVATTGQFVFWGMLIAHVVELATIWRPFVKRAPGSFAGNVVQVILFGVVHGQSMKADLARSSNAGS